MNHLPLNAVVVLDNASVHNKRAPGTPTSNTKKADMKDWLIEKNIEFPPRALRSELWEIIKDYLKQFPMYDVDEMVKRLRPDITLERLPPYHCELNPIELV